MAREPEIEIQTEAIDAATLADHGQIPIAFLVDRILDVLPLEHGFGGLRLLERPVDTPWVKDYDVDDGDGPTRWAAKFDLANWGLISARVDGVRVGGAVVAFDSPDVWMLDGRRDLASLWDLRVATERRGTGIGRRLFLAVAEWAVARGCVEVKIETQNVNVAACRFYAAMGCEATAIDRRAYVDLPDEAQIIWRRSLP